jgi:hypothetical protein
MSDPHEPGIETEWEGLPAAPPLVARGKTAQITLRLSASLLAQVKLIAAARSVPYHTLARSWLIEGLQRTEPPVPEETPPPQDEQLNVKLEQTVLDEIKARADELRRPYHRLAREWVTEGLAREQQRMSADPGQTGAPAAGTVRASSPYATGGGGTTFEHRIAARYLALMLTGNTTPELGGRVIASMAFQQAPGSPVDDLVLYARHPNKRAPSLELAVGVRRSPKLIPSDQETQKLIGTYISALLTHHGDGVEHRLALVDAGTRPDTRELAELTGWASKQKDPDSFFSLMQTHGKVRKALTDRLGYLTTMVGAALASPADPDSALVRQRTWQLLCSLSVITPRVEDPDTTDWVEAQNRLLGIARGKNLLAAGSLLDRLEVLAGQFAPAAATVDLTLLRRALHPLLEAGATRNEHGWQALEDLEGQALQVRNHLGIGADSHTFHLDRAAQGEQIINAATDVHGLVVHGESGVGKSAAVIGAATAAAHADEELEALCLNLRHLPSTSTELTRALGAPLQELLSELTAPRRLLVIDGADAATETQRDMFAYLICAAAAAEVKVIAVTASGSQRIVLDLLQTHLDGQITDMPLPGLSDEELTEITGAFPQLARLTANTRSRELLRRLVVVDLLVRSGLSGLPLSDVDAMREVWSGLIRRHESSERGTPDAREQVMLKLAAHQLEQGPAKDLLAALDPHAVDGLRHDGVLRAASTHPWEVLPEFAHDELRRFAVARTLLIDRDPTGELLRVGAPRWALSSATLAAQALLRDYDPENTPGDSRLGALQSAFDQLLSAGHGARWADVPVEALLSLGDPLPLLEDAWPGLTGGDAEALKRVLRLLAQRHRPGAIVDPQIAEPVIALLLTDTTPWCRGEEVARALREWLFALVVRETPAGHPLRIRLHQQILDSCTAAEERQRAEAEAAARALAERTPEQIREDEQQAKRNKSLFAELGFPRSKRRERPRPPRELTDETVIELLALLGPDLGEDGERLLRRVARDAPSELHPALEEPGAPRALASYAPGLLAELTEAYYVDDEDNQMGSGLLDDGVRDHRGRLPVAPLAAWYRGPFMALLQSDFRGGISALNRLLNHAARERIRSLAALHDRWNLPSDEQIDSQSLRLSITGEPRVYVGDPHVWSWYRGTSVGPYPCMSALQACELVCERLVEAKAPIDRLVNILLDGCENLAMVGLIVGLLVRHVEEAAPTIAPYLVEPFIWELEFGRHAGESSGLAANHEGVAHPERRTWSLREAATLLVLNADEDRVARLRTLADQLIANAEKIERDYYSQHPRGSDPESSSPNQGVSYTTRVRNWASALDRERYRIYTENGQTLIGSTPPEDVEQALQPSNEDLARGNETIRLVNRYYIQPKRGPQSAPPAKGELEADLATAQDLLEHPPGIGAFSVEDATALVAAAALHAHLLDGVSIPEQALAFAIQMLLGIAAKTTPSDELEYSGTYFEQGADRTAARVLPLLLLPQAATLPATRGELDVMTAARLLAQAVAIETRLHLARGLDPLWEIPCTDAHCHHRLALELAIDTMRDCIMGDWDPQGQRRLTKRLEGPPARALAQTKDDDLLIERLDPAIRALGVAAVSDSCVQSEAHDLLLVLLNAQRRGLIAHDHDLDQRGTHALIAARSLWHLAAAGERTPLLEHCETYVEHGSLLATMLRALAAAAEETPAAANAAKLIWPEIIEAILDRHADGADPFNDRYYGDCALAALAPNATYETEYLYRELQAKPIEWPDPLAWQHAIERWLALAAGNPRCVDSLIGLIHRLPAEEQATTGLGWVRALALSHAGDVAARSFTLQSWLIETRPAAEHAGTLGDWQELVDALVVAGASELAPYSE